MTRTGIAAFSRKLTIAFVCCLPFLVPFSGSPRNTDMQGLILILAGATGWLAVILGKNLRIARPYPTTAILLAIFMISSLASLAVNPHWLYDLLGAPHVRLGTAGFLACIGCGLALCRITLKQLITAMYLIITGLALVAVPYSWLHLHSVARISGISAQPDILAAFLGCGLMLGMQMLRYYPLRRSFLYVNQLLLFGLLIASGTRSILFITLILLPIYWQQLKSRWTWQWLVYLAVIGSLLCSAKLLLPTRLTDIGYAGESVHYRLDLKGAALQAAYHRPVAGYGPDNLTDALACPKLSAPDLQVTCKNHYYFNSSHDIFLDRVLAFGWAGGLAFAGLVISAIYVALRRGDRQEIVLGYTLAVIACYYLTNVTSLTLELLLWIILIRLHESTLSRA
jgi:hypothetical protein